MSSLSRRAALGASFSLLAAGAVAQGRGTTPAGFAGSVTTLERGGVRMHSYLSPASGYLVTSHVIETTAGPVLVDGQYDPGAARRGRSGGSSPASAGPSRAPSSPTATRTTGSGCTGSANARSTPAR